MPSVGALSRRTYDTIKTKEDIIIDSFPHVDCLVKTPPPKMCPDNEMEAIVGLWEATRHTFLVKKRGQLKHWQSLGTFENAPLRSEEITKQALARKVVLSA